jgi:hypothetical protein
LLEALSHLGEELVKEAILVGKRVRSGVGCVPVAQIAGDKQQVRAATELGHTEGSQILLEGARDRLKIPVGPQLAVHIGKMNP